MIHRNILPPAKIRISFADSSALGKSLSNHFPYSFTFEHFIEEVRGFVERKDLPAELTRKILWDNPKQASQDLTPRRFLQ
jgi:hypothetical protein